MGCSRRFLHAAKGESRFGGKSNRRTIEFALSKIISAGVCRPYGAESFFGHLPQDCPFDFARGCPGLLSLLPPGAGRRRISKSDFHQLWWAIGPWIIRAGFRRVRCRGRTAVPPRLKPSRSIRPRMETVPPRLGHFRNQRRLFKRRAKWLLLPPLRRRPVAGDPGEDKAT